jgi:hypothetical protein
MVPELVPAVRDLDLSVPLLPHGFANGDTATRLVLRQDVGTGRGVAVAPGASAGKGNILALYFVDITVGFPAGDYSLGLGRGGGAHSGPQHRCESAMPASPT